MKSRKAKYKITTTRNTKIENKRNWEPYNEWPLGKCRIMQIFGSFAPFLFVFWVLVLVVVLVCVRVKITKIFFSTLGKHCCCCWPINFSNFYAVVPFSFCCVVWQSKNTNVCVCMWFRGVGGGGIYMQIDIGLNVDAIRVICFFWLKACRFLYHIFCRWFMPST